jgi:hypothetical protein
MNVIRPPAANGYALSSIASARASSSWSARPGRRSSLAVTNVPAVCGRAGTERTAAPDDRGAELAGGGASSTSTAGSS